MLRFLKIANLAIIDEVQVEFHEGFNVLTGETGAGKSILIGALNLLLGAKAGPDLIRTGEEEASVEALFEVPNELEIAGLPEGISADGGEIILSRRLSGTGRSRCAVNGSLVPLGTLQAAGRALVSIFGQHEHQLLLNPDEHAALLDRFGGLQPLQRLTREAFAERVRCARQLQAAQATLQQMEHQNQDNAAAVEELTKVALRAGEEDELAQEREILRKAVQIRERAYEAHQAIYGRSGSILADLADVKKAVDFLVAVNPRLSGIGEGLNEAIYRLEDVAMELRNAAEKSYSDPARLEQIEERLGLIRRLKKKYGTDVEGLLRHLEQLNRESGDIIEARATVRKLENEVAAKRAAYLEAAQGLGEARRKTARRLEISVKKELKDLAMPDALFSVHFDDLGEDRGSADGMDRVEFLLSANPGEALRPLASIASGGELSRIMLAVKALQADEAAWRTVIFDEVDAGIGGRTASAVGTRLARVARSQQVLCVTHLHQIAALAGHHFSVKKSVRKGRTRIEVTKLGKEQRVEELTRMLGASPGSESARELMRRLMESPAMEVSG
ncbi:MAG: DNA repair protein RecN [Desulfomonile sp.]|nr:DNA repair protein RecN [Desulfomonile sp.]